jgi:hypothetical protein
LARHGDTTFSMEINPSGNVSLGRATPLAVYPIGLVGGLFGATAAFLLFGWVSRRSRCFSSSVADRRWWHRRWRPFRVGCR